MRELAMLRLLWEPTCHGNGRKHQQTATDTGDQPLPVVQRRTHTDDPHTHTQTHLLQCHKTSCLERMTRSSATCHTARRTRDEARCSAYLATQLRTKIWGRLGNIFRIIEAEVKHVPPRPGWPDTCRIKTFRTNWTKTRICKRQICQIWQRHSTCAESGSWCRYVVRKALSALRGEQNWNCATALQLNCPAGQPSLWEHLLYCFVSNQCFQIL